MTHPQPDPAGPQNEQEQTELAVHADLLLRKGAALEGLNKRIARLAIALGLELDTDAGLCEALEQGPQPAPHQHAFQAELRGLLTLRYQMEKQLVDDIGSETTQRMVSEVELHMESQGFRHGVDGIHEDALFDAQV